ncbi:MAG: 30S ribosomal protein S17 [Armatimonadota bacterium]
MTSRNNRKTKVAKVLKTSSEKTVIAGIERKFSHPFYKKVMKRINKIMVHDEKNECQAGDTVKIMETRPLSKRKKWRVIEVLEKAK